MRSDKHAAKHCPNYPFLALLRNKILCLSTCKVLQTDRRYNYNEERQVMVQIVVWNFLLDEMIRILVHHLQLSLWSKRLRLS
jgi:hypothetical protein